MNQRKYDMSTSIIGLILGHVQVSTVKSLLLLHVTNFSLIEVLVSDLLCMNLRSLASHARSLAEGSGNSAHVELFPALGS